MKIILIPLIYCLLYVTAQSDTTKLIKNYANYYVPEKMKKIESHEQVMSHEQGKYLRLTGWATYYTVASAKSEGTSGVLMASNKPYIETAMTCALPFHPPILRNRRQWGKKYRVTSLNTGQSVIVEHRDYGPGTKALSRGVIIDLTPAAFTALGAKLKQGRIRVRVERIK